MRSRLDPLLGVLVAFAACAGSQSRAVRFANTQPIEVVNDRADVPVAPHRSRLLRYASNYDEHFHKRVSRGLSVPRHRRALGVNAVDEVPDSTWFTNRLGIRELSPDEIRIGPVLLDSPEAYKPWSVLHNKQGGKSVGFIIRDTRGERYLLKFEQRGYPELETAAHVIVNRLLWAAGYNVPEDSVVNLRREDLVIAPDAVSSDSLGNERALTAQEIDRALSKIEIGTNGSIRALVSRIVAGEVLGGHPGRGVRADDPNDRIPHELRRDLRGSIAFYAWLDHVDLNEDNFLDVWTADPVEPRRHYVVHYLIDFGKALGAMGSISHDLSTGFEYLVDFDQLGKRFLRLGVPAERWRQRPVPPYRGVGLYDAATYDPGTWKPGTAAYGPVLTSDRFDKFWGAKLIARFTREQLRAAVLAAQLTDPRAVEYLTDTLASRARATAKYWFTRVNPLDQFSIELDAQGATLCFDDLAIVHRFAAAAATRYTLAFRDESGHEHTAPTQVAAGRLGRTCTGPLALPAAGNGYTIVRITTRRPGFTGSTEVHVARGPDGRPRVIGLWRE